MHVATLQQKLTKTLRGNAGILGLRRVRGHRTVDEHFFVDLNQSLSLIGGGILVEQVFRARRQWLRSSGLSHIFFIAAAI